MIPVIPFNFGAALVLLRGGQRVAREGWNGKGMWIAYSPGSTVEPGKLWSSAAAKWSLELGTPVEVRPYLIMKTADDQIVPWVASQSDLLADDWVLVN